MARDPYDLRSALAPRGRALHVLDGAPRCLREAWGPRADFSGEVLGVFAVVPAVRAQGGPRTEPSARASF